jgi:hypothetical protein
MYNLVIKLGTTEGTDVAVQHEIDLFCGFFGWRFHWELHKDQRKECREPVIWDNWERREHKHIEQSPIPKHLTVIFPNLPQ